MKPCPYCSSDTIQIHHIGLCPKIKSIEYYPDGETKKIEFEKEKPSQYPVWPKVKDDNDTSTVTWTWQTF